jgi:hypothetical protein
MGSLSEEEYLALKASIAVRGVEIPLVVDGEGEVIDGHHRRRAVAELRAEGHEIGAPPEIVREDLETEAEKRDEAWRLNMQRRHLNRAQKRDVIAAKLRESPEWANNRIASLLGVDGATVNSVRVELEAASEIPKLERLVGKDGKEYPRLYTNSLAAQVRFAEERKRREIRRALIQPSGKARPDADIAEDLSVRESEVAEQRADLQERGTKPGDFAVERGTPEAEELRKRRLREWKEARERGEMRQEDAKEALERLWSLWDTLHLAHKNPKRRVTPDDMVAQYQEQRMDLDVMLGYDERCKERWQYDVRLIDLLAKWLERFAEGIRSEVEVRIRTEEKAAGERRNLEEIERLKQKWKDSGGFVEE